MKTAALPLIRLTPLMLVLGLAGCGTGPIAGQPDETDTYARASLSDPDLQDAVRMNDATVTRTEQDLLHVVQPVRAAANEELFIEYRFVFFDAEGNVLKPEMGWRYKRLEQRVPDVISATSVSAEADDYRLLVRWARP